MSKASRLGTGSSFQQAQSISPRRQAINDATKAPTAGALPPVELGVDVISLNPANPRTELGDLSHLAGSMRDHGQKTAISIMSRFSYVEANPDHESGLEPGTKYVVIDGNSRLAAAREAGMTTIKVMLDESLGRNPDEILESALVANIHRQDLDHLDEARALEQLLSVHGTQEALAARLHRSQGWVSQRLALLKLTPDLQRKLETGEEPAELLRSVGRKKPDEQEEHLRLLKEKKARAAERKAALAAEELARETAGEEPAASEPSGGAAAETPVVPRPADGLHYGVMKTVPQSAAQTAATEPRPEPAAAPKPPASAPQAPAGAIEATGATQATEATKPVQVTPASADPARSTAEPDQQPRQIKMPWGDGAASMDIIFAKVFGSERQRMIGRYLELLGDPEAFVSDLVAASSPEYRRKVAELLLAAE
ncbi:ParB/RepB/Spo0J family partition protein [Streptomyces yaizuensis]|uniref:ParB/RepB/Spo0J family partition protein n=1 Tax=Streptomyces yaizuensis TaxID=2989713 RepID=A0ABQ5P975_9ACTN|nr:ParB/RepB/Spo0J family partition protein [Streptomyces sp. YSPA8]GLF99117.1 ParB/RepB/Spo0J family partition protein [Streptomyces sp. YSPA8]